ncbi:MAG: acyltransferase family protein [Gemmataceae bacterium]
MGNIRPIEPPARGWTSRLRRALSRETSTGQFVPEIDGLRFVAIAAVILFHLDGYIGLRHVERYGPLPSPSTIDSWMSKLVGVGAFGVQLFFAISGFILALPFAHADLHHRPRPSLRRYFMRRVTRLEPPYIVNLLIWYPAQILLKGGTALGLLPNLLASIFYLHVLIYGERSRINQVTWTLEIEVQFYCLAPLLTRVFQIRSTMWRRCLIAGVMLLLPVIQCSFLDLDSPYVMRTIVGNLQYFLAGFLLADLFLVDWRRNPSLNFGWDFVGAASWILMLVVLNTSGNLFLFVTPFTIVLAYISAFRGPISRRFFRAPAIVIIGGMCYTIYLYHWMCYFALGPLTLRLYDPLRPHWVNFAIQSLTLVPLMLVCCSVLFVLLEKPFMRPDWVDRALCALDWFKRKRGRQLR